MGLAMAVFAADRAFPSPGGAGPRQAGASEYTVSPAESADMMQTKDTRCPQDLTTTGGASVTRRLEQIARRQEPTLEDLRDAFCPSRAWIRRVAPHAPAAAPENDLAAEFMQTHNLQAVIVCHQGGCAIVDNRVVNVGQELDGFTLTSVTTRTAVFTSDQTRVTLQLPASAGADDERN